MLKPRVAVAGSFEEVDPILKCVSLFVRPRPERKRFASALVLCAVYAVLVLGTGAAPDWFHPAWAQRTSAADAAKEAQRAKNKELESRSVSRPAKNLPAPKVAPASSRASFIKQRSPSGVVPQGKTRHAMVGNAIFLPKDVTRRSTKGVKGFDTASATGRATIGGSNGVNVQEQVVNLTQTPAIDERVPVWSSDARFLYFAGSPQNAGANARYGLYRVSADAPPSSTVNPPVALTDPTDSVNDYYFPALNRGATRIAFLRSSDGKGVDDTTKRYELYVANIPTATGQFIDQAPNGPSGLQVLTVGKDFPNGSGGRAAFTNIGRPAWLGNNDIVFAGQLAGDTNYHIFTINLTSRNIFQLTGSNGASSSDERNPMVSPNGVFIAFDSNATPNTTGGTYNNVITSANNGPVTVTRVRSESDVSAPLAAAPRGGSTSVRNIFVMGNLGQNVTQITGQYASAPANISSFHPTWTTQDNDNFTNIDGQTLYIGFSSNRIPTFAAADTDQGSPTGFTAGSASTLSIYYVVFTRSGGTGSVSPPRIGDGFFGEAAPTDVDSLNADGARLLDTGNETATAIGGRDLTRPRFADQYPTFAPFTTVFRAGFQSNREGTLARNGFGTGFTLTPISRNNLFIASIIDINAPSLIRYDTSAPTGEVVHVNLVTDANRPYNPGGSVRSRDDGITPGSRLHFAVRVEDRESGMRPETSADGGAVYLMFKNPNSKYQSIAQGGNGVEHKEFGFGNSFLGIAPPNDTPGFGNVTNGYSVGYEFEAEPISAADRTTYYQHLFSTVGNPSVYVPGISDRSAFSGVNNPPLDGQTRSGITTDNIWLRLTPLVQKNADGSNVLDANGNTIPIRPTDGLGGVLYGATWQIPSEASDWYIDVILYDNAVNPFDRSARSNFIMYDNVWGFSSAAPISGLATDILVVADYTLGQKFFNSRFGESPLDPFGSAANLQPVFYGAESYFTDIDIARFPSEQQGGAVDPPPGGTTNRPYDGVTPFLVSGVAGGLVPPGGVSGFVNGQTPASQSGTPNVLGVESYDDELLDLDAVPIDGGYRLPTTGRYNIWRVLSRGPVPASLLTDYLPQRTTAPADLRAGESAVRPVANVNRMVVWSSPFSGDLFVGAGTITDLTTQNNLTNFVTSGGRLFISGQDIGFALAGNGQQNPFFSNILKARYVRDDGTPGGSSGLTEAADPTTTFVDPVTGAPQSFGYVRQIHHDAWDSRFGTHAYGRHTGAPIPFVYTAPDDNGPGNNSDLRVNNGLPGSATGDASATSETTAGFPDSIAALATSGTNLATATVPPDSVLQFNYTATGEGAILVSSYPSGTSAVGLEQPYSATLAATPQGKVAYASLGFESISQGYYAYTLGQQTVIANLGRRTEIMHNIDCAFRTGTLTGRIVDNNGSAVTGALVRAVYSNIGNEPAAASGTAITDESGNFQIVGLQPGFYVLFGYKAGFYTQHNIGNSVHGGSRSNTNLSLKAASPGGLSGVPNATARNAGGVFLSDGVTPVPNIEIQVRRQNADGSFTAVTTFSSDGVTNSSPAGAYSFPNLLIANYQVIANARTKVVNGQIVPKAVGPDGKYLASEHVNEAFGEVRVLVAAQTTVRKGAGTVVVNDPSIGDAVTIAEGITAQIDFLLPSAPQAVHGQVVVLNTTTPIANATVSATLNGSTTVVATGTTDANGNYTLTLVNPTTGQDPTLIPGGTYIIHADANGYNSAVPPSVNDVSVAVGGASTLPFATAPTIGLAALPPGSVSGLVTINNGSTAATTTGVTGAKVAFYAITTVNGVDQQSTTATFTLDVTEPVQTASDNTGYRFNYRGASVAPGRYNAFVTKSGLTGSPNPYANVVITTGTETRNINFTLEPPRIYGAGVQLVSVPFDYSTTAPDPRTIFGLSPTGDNNGNGTANEITDQTIYSTFNVADWTGTDYNISPTIPLRLGKGYFVRFGAISIVTAPSGGSAQGAFTVNLANGWNLIGHPFDNRAAAGSPAPDINIADPTVVTFSYTIGQTSRTNVGLSTAVSDGAVGSVTYSYTGSNAGSTYVQTGLIRPYFGYWFRAFTPVSMTLQYPDPAYRSVGGGRLTAMPKYITAPKSTGNKFVTQTREALDKPVFRAITSKGLSDWRLQIAAQQGDLKDSDNSIGVAADAKAGFDNRYDNEKPPMVEANGADSLYVGISGTNASGKATQFSDSVQNAFSGGTIKSWEFNVKASNAGNGDVTITWPNAARLPRGVEPVLIDTVSGKRVNMRTGGSSYRFTPSAGRATHTFRVEVAPPATTPLDLVNVHMSRVQGSATGRAAGGVRIAFTTTRDADVVAEVQTLTGQVVRSFTTRAARGSETAVNWDGRNAIGSDIPAGMYMLKLTAHDTRAVGGGAQVSRSIPIMSVR